jgi:hypothetical protein
MLKRWGKANHALMEEYAERARVAEAELLQSSQDLRELHTELEAKM